MPSLFLSPPPPPSPQYILKGLQRERAHICAVTAAGGQPNTGRVTVVTTVLRDMWTKKWTLVFLTCSQARDDVGEKSRTTFYSFIFKG